MDLGKRIRVVFKDNDILSDNQKLEGLSRSWVLLEPHRHDAVYDLASHLLHAFRLHQSCPHGLLLSISGFTLPPFVSTSILKDNEIISVRKRKGILTIEGNDAANDVHKLKALEKQPVDGGVLLLANEEFEKEKGGYESDESEKVSEDDDDEVLLDVVQNSSGGKSNKKNRKRKVAESEDDDEVPSEVVEKSAGGHSRKQNRKRKAAERLEGNKEKKQRSVVTGNVSSDVCKEKKDASAAGDNVETKNEPTKHSDKNNDVVELGEERTVDVQEKDNETDDAKIASKETKKAPSRSARRKTKKRRWLREMAKIQKQNATCESEGLRNWKEDQAKAERKKTDGQLSGHQKWKKYQADAEWNKADGQPKGLLHWKLSSQNNGVVKGKKHKRHNRDDFLELPKQNVDAQKQKNQNGDVHKQQNQNDDKHEQLTQMGDTSEQPSHSLHEQPGQSSPSVQERTNQNCVASKQSNHKSAEEDEVVPIEIRPGHIRFEPLEEEEAMQQDHAPLETFNWNGITSKKKGQQWGKENRRFTPINDYRTNKDNFETATKEEKKQPIERIDFDKLPPLPGSPKKGDLIAYRLLELSSTWTPELSAHRVGKVSWYDAESHQTMLLPVPEYPIISEEDGENPIISEEDSENEAAQHDTSLYKKDGSLEIDFSALVDVRVLTNGGSKPGNKAGTCMSEASTSNVNSLKTVLPGTSGEPTAEPNPDTQESDQGKETQPPSGEIGGSVWDQLSEALNAKKEQLSKENGWGSTPKKVVVSHENSWGKNAKKVQPSPGSNWGKKPLLSQDNSWKKQNACSKSWSYKTLRGSALGPTMALLRSKRDT